ncbi:helix-turn-helix domain-containing protein [Mycolicibacterium fortuitum]|uniref:helix-turn-helix domain-containing protein n=1 Tax=Mycolicibacterium fortuitum TaxID=1766 RepID=UPI0007EA9D18|nr:helix-turn-helix domain-containing protein [Mycolicibacterium fortuitum]OBB35260.1 hypothetical protein A5763_00435 [Mycolicibacterium fortuitum]OBB41707.1 hypothetical protein A5754_16720 [Mycolicibacterium fortuitum]OBB63174.1 hypothetical protein A5755_21930 [Mycolicibacterium fortuitum]OBF87196.1 hypothetical protein A5751_07525 [Mycolicibacterium fortuitum]
MADERDGAARSGDPLDAHFATNMTRLREAAGLSQAEMVQKLREQGWKNVHPTTISRIEKGERPVRLSEAARIAKVLEQDLYRMMTQPRRAGIEEEVDKHVEKVVGEYNKIVEGAYWLTLYRKLLRSDLGKLSEIAEREGDARLQAKFEEYQPYLGLRIDNAVRAAREATTPGALGGQGGGVLLERYGVTPHSYHPDVILEADINAPNA